MDTGHLVEVVSINWESSIWWLLFSLWNGRWDPLRKIKEGYYIGRTEKSEKGLWNSLPYSERMLQRKAPLSSCQPLQYMPCVVKGVACVLPALGLSTESGERIITWYLLLYLPRLKLEATVLNTCSLLCFLGIIPLDLLHTGRFLGVHDIGQFCLPTQTMVHCSTLRTFLIAHYNSETYLPRYWSYHQGTADLQRSKLGIRYKMGSDYFIVYSVPSHRAWVIFGQKSKGHRAYP